MILRDKSYLLEFSCYFILNKVLFEKDTLAPEDLDDAGLGNDEKAICYKRLRKHSQGLDITIPSVVSHLNRPFQYSFKKE